MKCMRILRAFVAAYVLTCVTHAHANPPETEFNRRIEELVRWISSKTDYPAKAQRVPEFVFLPPDAIGRAFSGASALSSNDQISSIRAFHVKGTIYLPDTFQLGKDDYMLLHELVHHMQAESGKKFDCPAQKEHEAYWLQTKFVDETGTGEKPNDLFMLFLTCDYR